MRYVGYDQFRKRPADLDPGRPPVGGFLTPALLFASVALLVLSRVDHGYIASARVAIADWVSPVVRLIMIPLEPVRAAGAASSNCIACSGTFGSGGGRTEKATRRSAESWKSRRMPVKRPARSISQPTGRTA